MIRKDNLTLAENIAAGLGNKVIKTTPILDSLNAESYGVFPYTEKWRSEVVEVTSQVTAHGELMDVATTRMAEIIRESFDMIKTYGTPLATRIANAMNLLFTPSSLNNLSTGDLGITFVNVDHPFFNSSIYPRAPRNVALTFENTDLNVLKRIKFKGASSEELKDWLETNHPEMRQIVESKESDLFNAFYSLTNFDNLTEIFNYKNGVFNFTEIKQIEIDKLMKMYSFAAKMFVQSTPCAFLTEGSGEDYREFVDLIYGGLTIYLINLKKRVELFRQRGLVLVENTPVELADVTPTKALGVKVKLLRGNVTVYFTEAVLEAAATSNTALRDVVVAYLYGSLTRQDVGLASLAGNAGEIARLLNVYRFEISERMSKSAFTYFREAVLGEISKFISETPEVLERLDGVKDTSVKTIVTGSFDKYIEALYALYNRFITDDKGEEAISVGSGDEDAYRQKVIDIVLRSKLIPDYLRFIGCTTSADILEFTYVTQTTEDNINSMRERVTLSVIKFLAPKLIG